MILCQSLPMKNISDTKKSISESKLPSKILPMINTSPKPSMNLKFLTSLKCLMNLSLRLHMNLKCLMNKFNKLSYFNNNNPLWVSTAMCKKETMTFLALIKLKATITNKREISQTLVKLASETIKRNRHLPTTPNSRSEDVHQLIN